MTIPTRDELIDRWKIFFLEADATHYETTQKLQADFALSEIRRAVREELETLRRTRCHRVVASDPTAHGWNEAIDFVSAEIDRRLAALRQAEHEQPPVVQRTGTSCAPSDTPDPATKLGQNLERASSTLAPGITDKPWAESRAPTDRASERAEGRAASSPCPPPALTDADEKAWLIELNAEGAPTVWLGRCGWTSPDFAVRFAREQDARDAYAIFTRVPSPHVKFTEHVWCAPLRAASAPVPVPKLVDTIERVIACAAEVEVITDDEERAALAALSELRRKAQEASR